MSSNLHVPEFNNVDKLKSTLSNFLLIDENWKNLRKFLEALMNSISGLIDETIIDEIKESVIERLDEFKNTINFVYTVDIDYTSVQGKYSVTKLSDRSLKVESVNNPQWDSTSVIVQVQEKNTGEVVYPIITKNTGNFTVELTNEFYSDLEILFI